MRKIILAALGTSLIVTPTMQMAIAAEHHNGRKVDRVSTSQKFRNANDFLALPARSTWSSDYREGHGVSAPAGR
jgi:hypothetical protein